MWAASVDFGENAMISLLLRAGAKIQAHNREGQTAAQLAVKYQYLNHIAVLQESAIKTQQS
jgi:hypothetical protein